MDEKPDQILGQIEAQRHELGRNLEELETRVRRSTDWKTYVDRNPMMMLGVALGGGLLLGAAAGRRNHHGGSRHRSSGLSSSALGLASAGTTSSSSRSPLMAAQRKEVSETLEYVKAALVGFGISKAKEFMCQAIPGFGEHLSEAQQKRQSFAGAPSGQGGAWEQDTYSSGGRDNSGSFGNRGSGSPGQAGYRPEPVGSAPLATP